MPASLPDGRILAPRLPESGVWLGLVITFSGLRSRRLPASPAVQRHLEFECHLSSGSLRQEARRFCLSSQRACFKRACARASGVRRPPPKSVMLQVSLCSLGKWTVWQAIGGARSPPSRAGGADQSGTSYRPSRQPAVPGQFRQAARGVAG